jgi:hypothetical protein
VRSRSVLLLTKSDTLFQLYICIQVFTTTSGTLAVAGVCPRGIGGRLYHHTRLRHMGSIGGRREDWAKSTMYMVC